MERARKKFKFSYSRFSSRLVSFIFNKSKFSVFSSIFSLILQKKTIESFSEIYLTVLNTLLNHITGLVKFLFTCLGKQVSRLSNQRNVPDS